MSGETDLDALLAGLSADLMDGVYVFVTISAEDVPQNITPQMVFREKEGITLIMLRDEAEDHSLPNEFPCRMITLKIHSSLEAVGFMARIATELAKEGMGVNPVAGFYHDHLFVPEGREQDALRVLSQIARAAQ